MNNTTNAPRKTNKIPKSVAKGSRNTIESRKAKKNVKKVLPLAAADPLIEEVMRAIASPLEFQPHRVATVYDSSLTAVANPWQRLPVTDSSPPLVGRLMPVGQQLQIVQRIPEAAIIKYTPAANPPVTSQYIPASVFKTGLENLGFESINNGDPQDMNFTSAQWQTGPKVHGNLLFAASIKDRPNMKFFWARNKDTLDTTVFNHGAGPADYEVEVFGWDPTRGIFSIVVVGFAAVPAAGFVNHVITLDPIGPLITDIWHGYVGLSVKRETALNGGTTTTTLVKINYNNDVFSHLPLPDLVNNLGAVDSVRIIAASAMYTNTASPLNRQGEITGYQSSQGTHWADYVGNYEVLKSKKGSVTKDIQNGMFGFLKITQPSDLSFKSDYEHTGGQLTHSEYSLDTESAFLVMYEQTTGGVTESGIHTFAFGVEYQTGDTWRDLGYPTLPVEVYGKAIEGLRFVEQFHENPSHLSNIWNSVKSAAKTVLDGIVTYAPTAVKVASTLLPLLL